MRLKSTALTHEVSVDLTHETLERQLSDQEFSRLLVFANFTQGNCPGSETVRSLDVVHVAVVWSTRLRGKLLARSLCTAVLH
eukprot:421716-Rhodomonas_salina.2